MRSRHVRAITVALFAAAAAGCSVLFGLNAEYTVFYQLPSPTDVEEVEHELPYRLVLPDARGVGFVSTPRIVFTKSTFEQGYYQFASWVEPPPQRITTLILEELRRTGAFQTVSRVGSGVVGDLQLNLELRDFSHYLDSPPGKGRMEIAAELVDLTTHQSLGQRRFESEAPAASFDSAGAVAALSTVSSTLVKEIVAWVYETAAAHATSPHR